MSSNTMIGWRPENVIRNLPWHLDSKAALGFLLILATFSLIGWLYLTQASAVTTTTYRIDELRLELDQINHQNTALALQIAQLESLNNIEKRAIDLGLVPTQNIRYLTIDNYPTSTQKCNTPYQTITKMDIRPLNCDKEDVPGYIIGPEAKEEVITNEPTTWWVGVLDKFTAWLAHT